MSDWRRVQVPFDPSRAKVIVAFVGEDEDLVTEAAIDLARGNRARGWLPERHGTESTPWSYRFRPSDNRLQFGRVEGMARCAFAWSCS